MHHPTNSSVPNNPVILKNCAFIGLVNGIVHDSRQMKAAPPESRPRQIIWGALIIGLVGLILVLFWFGRHLPAPLGEWFGLIVGIATSPFLMPVAFVLLGFFVVNTLNSWRRHREGGELVYLETAEGPGSNELPDSARNVIYDKRPLPSESPDLITRLEGAMAIQDHDGALEILGEMSEPQCSQPAVLCLRIQLANATGKADLASRLRRQLDDH